MSRYQDKAAADAEPAVPARPPGSSPAWSEAWTAAATSVRRPRRCSDVPAQQLAGACVRRWVTSRCVRLMLVEGPQCGCLRSREAGARQAEARFPPPLQVPGTGWPVLAPGWAGLPGEPRAIGTGAVACWSPALARATRSHITYRRPLARRDGLVHRLVDAEDLRQPGDPQDLQDPLLRADQIQRAVVSPHPPQAPDQHPEAGGVEEPDPVQVDDELVAAPC